MSTVSRRAKEPSYRHHKPSGQAFVQLRGKRYYLGKHGTEASRKAYSRFLEEHWAPPDAPSPPAEIRCDLTVVELLDRYWTFAHAHYVKHGEPTGTTANIKPALRRLREIYGTTPAARFGPLTLKALRLTWVRDGLAVKTANHYVATIRQVFAWGVSEELLPPLVVMALKTVRGLRRDRGEARDPLPIGPVRDERVEATLPHLPPIVADMVRFQRLTGCRPCEVRLLRPGEVETAAEVWSYKPGRHKTEHHGRQRIILVGPRAQEVLRPYLLKGAFQPGAPCFQTNTGRGYTKERYNRTIRRACEIAFNMPVHIRERALRDAAAKRKDGKPALDVGKRAELLAQAAEWWAKNAWRPNQLRHAAATQIRKECGSLEQARVVLGHAQTSTAEIYAERDLGEAAAIMKKIG